MSIAIKRYVKRYLFAVVAITQFQALYKVIHRLSLWTMNIGLGGGVEESGEKYILTTLRKDACKYTTPPVIFDVGANQGQFAQAVLKIFDQNVIIYSFEPSVNTFCILKAALTDYTNVKIYNYGLGESNEELTLYMDKKASGEASLYKRQVPGKTYEITETIKIITLDNFCVDNNINHIHYLKLDVEGHELSVLKGAKCTLLSGMIDWIQFEFGGCNIDSRTYFRDFFDLLSPNYIIYRLVRNGLVSINRYHETLEIFTTTNFIAISKAYANS